MKQIVFAVVILFGIVYPQDKIADYAQDWKASEQEVMIDGIIKKVSCIYVDVDLRAYKLSSIPFILCSLEGNKNHWEAIGVNSIYHLTLTGFRVYLYYRDGVSPDMAKNWGWRLAWIGFKTIGN